MPAPVTISLPFTNTEEAVTSKWYQGSRMRNRTLTIIAAFVGCTLFLSLIRQFTRQETTIRGTTKSGTTVYPVYEGVDVTLHDISHLIVVAGHAIWRGGLNYTNDEDWILEDMQKGQTNVFVRHITEGLKLATADSKSLLVFSGGESRSTAHDQTEAQSYSALAELLLSSGQISLTGSPKMTTEQYARDSYENLLFSIARFYELSGRYPSKFSVISYTFKKTRFAELHAKALQIPSTSFTYHGIDPKTIDLMAAEQGELNNARALFENDLYGCHNPRLLQKKKARNPARRRHGYELSNPLIADLIEYCPSNGITVFPGKLPWS